MNLIITNKDINLLKRKKELCLREAVQEKVIAYKNLDKIYVKANKISYQIIIIILIQLLRCNNNKKFKIAETYSNNKIIKCKP
jgi:hypothetical protein